jgi:hypothetical protein
MLRVGGGGSWLTKTVLLWLEGIIRGVWVRLVMVWGLDGAFKDHYENSNLRLTSLCYGLTRPLWVVISLLVLVGWELGGSGSSVGLAPQGEHTRGEDL